MKFSHHARTALAVLAIAAGLIGTTLPAPALAAPASDSRTPMPAPRPSPAPQPPGDPKNDQPPLPDVSVKVVGVNGSNLPPSFLDVAFNLQTTGADANNVALKAECVYHDQQNVNYTRYEDQPVKQMSLSASWPVPVPYLVTCAPQGTELVATVYLKADVPGGDSNPSNNFAYWDHLSGPWK